jgi:hypothetical protein
VSAPPKPSQKQQQPLLISSLSAFRIDFAPEHKQPTASSVVMASLLSILGSLAVDAILVAVGTRIFPATRGYVHFQFSDYAKLTTLGVIIACIGWPVVTRISSAPRWVFLRMAIVVTAVLFLPDLYILAKGQPPKAVLVLMIMHLAIALVTYNALVHLAPAKRSTQGPPRPRRH